MITQTLTVYAYNPSLYLDTASSKTTSSGVLTLVGGEDMPLSPPSLLVISKIERLPSPVSDCASEANDADDSEVVDAWPSPGSAGEEGIFLIDSPSAEAPESCDGMAVANCVFSSMAERSCSTLSTGGADSVCWSTLDESSALGVSNPDIVLVVWEKEGPVRDKDELAGGIYGMGGLKGEDVWNSDERNDGSTKCQ